MSIWCCLSLLGSQAHFMVFEDDFVVAALISILACHFVLSLVRFELPLQ